MTFSTAGALVGETDPNGYTTALAYFTSGANIGLLSTVTDPAGRTLTFTYNSAQQVAKVTDSSGRTVTYGYDSAGNDELTSVTDPAGRKTQYGYDANYRLTTITDPNLNVTTNHYNDSGQVDSQTDGAGRKTTFTYNTNDTVMLQDQLGNQTLEQYNGYELTSETLGYGTTSASTTNYTFDPATLGTATVQNISEPGEPTWTYTYDAAGNRISTLDPDNDLSTTTYNDFDEPLVVTTPAPDGTPGDTETTTNVYDSHGNIQTSAQQITSASTATTTYTYGDTHPGDVTAIKDPNGFSTTYVYDTFGQLSSTSDPTGDKTSNTYTCTPAGAGCRSNIGWTYSTVTPRGNASTPANYTYSYTYNDDGQQLTSKDPLGHTTTYVYDSDGNVHTAKDPDTNLTTYTYNGDNQPTVTTLPDTTQTKVNYDGDGDVLQQITGFGSTSAATTSYTYDPLNRTASMTTPPTATNPAGITTGYQYDPESNLTAISQPGDTGPNLITTKSYDAANRLTATSYSDGITPNVTYSYYPDGQRKTMTDGTGTTSYSYNLAGWLTNVTDGSGSSVGDGYDLDGNVTAITYPNNKTVTRGFNHDDQLSSVTDWNSGTTNFTYDPDGDPLTMTYPNGVAMAETADRADNAATITYTNSGGSLDAFTVTRDADANILADTVTGNTDGDSSSYTYNSLGQVNHFTYPTTDPTTSGPYTYDTAGDLTTQPTGYTQTYDPASELTLTGRGGINTGYTDNPRGDRVSMAPTGGPTQQSYTYNQANQLTSYSNTAPATTASYIYNGDGLRTSKTVGTTTNTFSWDQATSSTPLLLADGVTDYLYGPGGLPIEEVGSGTTLYLLTDEQGSVRALTGPTGALAGVYDYDPYGNVVQHVGAISSLRYTGQYQDDESGLYYLQARYYDPSAAQFLTRDPLEDETGQPYSYAGDDPIDNADPSGQNWLSNAYDWSVENLDPVSYALPFYANEWDAAENGCSPSTVAKYGAEGVVVLGLSGFDPEDGPEIDAAEHLWPDTAEEMDSRLGQTGTRVPDGPTTPGRNKVTWDTPNGKITYEQHPYHADAPDWHQGPHWHYEGPGGPHQRAVPGDPYPF